MTDQATGQPGADEGTAAQTPGQFWNVYVPGPTSGTDWYQSYIRAGATDPSIEDRATLVKAKSSDLSAGILLYTSGKISQNALTSSITTFGGETYAATINDDRLYSATYQYDQGNNYLRQVVVANGGKFSLTSGDQENIIFGNKMDCNMGNQALISGPLKFDSGFGLTIKFAPIYIGISNNRIEIKGGGGAFSSVQPDASLRAASRVTIANNPLTDAGLIVSIKGYSAAMNVVNKTLLALTAAFAVTIGAEGIRAWGGKSEDGIKAEMKALRGQFIGLMSLFAVTEAVALVLAALALKKQALDPGTDYPVASSITVTPSGIRLQAGPMCWIELTQAGIVLTAPALTTNSPLVVNQPMLQPALPEPLDPWLLGVADVFEQFGVVPL